MSVIMRSETDSGPRSKLAKRVQTSYSMPTEVIRFGNRIIDESNHLFYIPVFYQG